jgi:hypothetical protein
MQYKINWIIIKKSQENFIYFIDYSKNKIICLLLQLENFVKIKDKWYYLI